MPQIDKTFAIIPLHSEIKVLLESSRKRESNKSECGSYGHLVRVIGRRERASFSLSLLVTLHLNLKKT